MQLMKGSPPVFGNVMTSGAGDTDVGALEEGADAGDVVFHERLPEGFVGPSEGITPNLRQGYGGLIAKDVLSVKMPMCGASSG
jgi:hypothetical protein